jgi:2',3'-cyclic-nucleotide 2'-phosphodiesterase (5'-nucleotidase family)
MLGPDGSYKGFSGGFSRRATIIAAERAQEKPVLVVDAGNFLVPNPAREFDPEEKNALVVDLMGRVGYDVVTPGDLELIPGIEAIKTMMSRCPDVQVVSANIRDRDGQHVWPAFAVVERQGVRFGVTGATSPAFYDFNVRRGLQKVDEFTFLDPKEAVSALVPKLRTDVDVVVLLLHMGPEEAYDLVRSVGGADVAVVGHNSGRAEMAMAIGGTQVLRTGQRGNAIGIVELEEEDGRFHAVRGRTTTVEHAVTPDPEIEQLVSRYEDQERAYWERRRVPVQRGP